MAIATQIPQDAFEALQTNAGVICWNFNPASPSINSETDIVTATTGGVTASCKPTYSDYGEDVDNCPNNMKEFKRLDGWECSFSTTGLGTSPALIKLALGAADIDSQDASKIVPRRDLLQSDFRDLWWVGDKADGGLVAVKLMNALSTGGFELKTEKNGKGQTSIELTGHVSIHAQNVVPMQFWSIDYDDMGTGYSVVQRLTNVTSNYETTTIASGDDFEATLTADTGYTIENVVVLMGGVDVTDDAWASATSKVSIDNVSGMIEIIATANTTT